MDILPPAVPAVPNPCLFWLAWAGTALAVYKLRQSNVGDAGCFVSDHVHMRVEDSGVDGFAVLRKDWQERDEPFQGVDVKLEKAQKAKKDQTSLTIVKVKSMEIHALHQIPQPLGLKRGKTRVADLPVS